MTLLQISTWWAEKDLLEQIYWGCALPASAILLIILVTTLMGSDGSLSDAVDAEVEGDAGAGFQFFTLKNLIGFFTIFGWVGIGCYQGGMGAGMSLAISMVSGLAMMATMASLFYFMSRLVEDGTFRTKSAVGKTGEIYLPVPGKKKGVGKVQFSAQGAVRELQAMTDEEDTLPTGTVVTIVDILDGHILLVRRPL